MNQIITRIIINTERMIIMIIGKNIKYFRNKQSMTQEVLSELLGVSISAVSQWESEKTTPDISIIPALCSIFNITSDTLLGIDIENKEKSIKNTLDTINTMSDNDIPNQIKILETEIEKFPDSTKLKLKVAELYSKVSTEKYYAKIVNYLEYVNCNSNNTKEKYFATQLLCYIYRNRNNTRIIELANELPEIYQTKPALIYFGYTGEKYEQAVYEYLEKLLDTAKSIINIIDTDIAIKSNNYFNKIKNEIKQINA